MERRLYKKNDDGAVVIETVSYTVEDQIAEKESKLLEIYAEIQKLKEQQ